LQAAKGLTILSAMMMAAVVIGTIVQLVDENTSHPPDDVTTVAPGPTPNYSIPTTTTTTKAHLPWFFEDGDRPSTTAAPSIHLPMSVTSMYLAGLTAVFILTAVMHLPEAYCLFHGIWYLLCLPAGNLIMMIYSICNLTDRSWGA
jgi:chitin synthase